MNINLCHSLQEIFGCQRLESEGDGKTLVKGYKAVVV